jgi:hypothetical protein
MLLKLKSATDSLSREIMPPKDLWPGIANRIRRGAFSATIVRHDFGKEATPRFAPGTRKRTLWYSVAAALLAAVGTFLFSARPEGPAWSVESLGGIPLVDDERVTRSGELHVGDWLETDAKSKARLSVGVIGEVEIEPNTRLRLVQAHLTDHRIALQQGTIHATIWAPPRLFFVETPSAVAVDLGCAYTLAVDATGASFLHVTSGYVALEFDGRESFIPEGGMCATRPGRGPGTPFVNDASELMRTALMHYDFDHGGVTALKSVLAESRKDDALTLWHLLKSTEGFERKLVFDRLSTLAPPPESVSRDGILQGDREMLEQWREDLIF